MLAFDCFGALTRRLIALLTLLSVFSLLPVRAADTADSVTPELNAASAALESCLSIKESQTPIWTIKQTPSLIAGSVTTNPYTNPRGLTGTQYSGNTKHGTHIVWTTLHTVAGLSSMQIETSVGDVAHSQWILDGSCQLLQHRRIVYDQNLSAVELLVFDPDSGNVLNREPLNPALPKLSSTAAATDTIRVAMVDSGVNYTLPVINARLARDTTGELIGYDFWENDKLPFDLHFSASPFRITRHGTGTASLLLSEAPFVELVPYRYPRPDMSRMQALIEHAANNQVRIIGIPLGGNKADQWREFEIAAKQHPDILFISSAGNNGRNIDQQPVYPASLDLDNLLVVTSADDFVVPAERVNWGRSKVDYMLPAEEQPIINFNGENATASGSSYAVPRAVAMAARMLRDHPEWRARELTSEFARRFADGSSSRYVGGGYISDPLANDQLNVNLVGVQTLNREQPIIDESEERVYKLPLSVFVLDEGWSNELVNNSLIEAEQILAQCNIVLNSVTISELSIPDYLRDLETGTARTLISALNNDTEFKPIKVFYARDTRMLTPFDGEAFGRGNTRRRPWLQDSVWLMSAIKDAGIALAHELFHVLSNSGEHNQVSNNLMQTRTSPGNVMLEPEQCDAAIRNAKEHLILFD